MTTIAARPSSISGCLQTFTETWENNQIRTTMENGAPKVRNRVTWTVRLGQASVVLLANQYNDFKFWYETSCRQGVLPTRFKMPNSTVEEVWRFVEPPTIEWDNSGKAFRATFKLEQLPQWDD